MTGTLRELGDHVVNALPGAALRAEAQRGELTLTVAR